LLPCKLSQFGTGLLKVQLKGIVRGLAKRFPGLLENFQEDEEEVEEDEEEMEVADPIPTSPSATTATTNTNGDGGEGEEMEIASED
jgi:hypothetical protein